MPLLEAPPDLSESSPEVSIDQEVPVGGPAQIPVLPIAAAQVRLATPEPQSQAEVLYQNNRNRERNLRVLGSYDLDIIEAEEENHFPAYVHLLPVVMPPQAPEPTLDELLVGINGNLLVKHCLDIYFRDALHRVAICIMWRV